MLNSIRKKILTGNALTLGILLFVLIYAIGELKSNQELLAQQEAAEEQTEAGAEQTNAASAELSKLSEELRSAVAQFKV